MGHVHPVLIVLAEYDRLYHVCRRIQAVLEYCKSILIAVITHVTEEIVGSQPRPVKNKHSQNHETILRNRYFEGMYQGSK